MNEYKKNIKYKNKVFSQNNFIGAFGEGKGMLKYLIIIIMIHAQQMLEIFFRDIKKIGLNVNELEKIRDTLFFLNSSGKLYYKYEDTINFYIFTKYYINLASRIS
ncbi:hypothetical protein PFUGPA_00122 [Plasmodium falciparum Palo Alto/Uganda]|uniref:Uncharacterized protein n=1 Tax=Plasmodium falciparum (isolate Palo Alto / Uganda) TaxID=57270 RepID=W4J6U7_PLAFP|nr:hypothetical protein PFUGPA_00122 [Plasmodium falciparum Palo Alto/Uganda]